MAAHIPIQHARLVFLMVVVFLVFVLPPFCTLASQRVECFVDVTNGNDSDTCGNQTNPCQSIVYCIDWDTPYWPTLPNITWLYPGKYVGKNNCGIEVIESHAVLMPIIPNSYVEIDCHFDQESPCKDFIYADIGTVSIYGLIISNTDIALEIIDASKSLSFQEGDSSIINCTIKGCQAGGIEVSYGNSLSIINSTFINNGELFIDIPAFISNSQFINNQGLAIYDNSVTIVSSSFISNFGVEGYGGALFLDSDGYIEIYIEDCVFDGNNADMGGAIVLALQGVINITSTVFKNNIATSNGSALYIFSSPQVTHVYLNNVTFVNNSASSQQQGGAILISPNNNAQVKPFRWNNVLIQNNTGGGIVLNDVVNVAKDFTITGLTLSNNIPFNLQCFNSPNLTFCESACVAKTCSACPGSCDITKNSSLPICHHFASIDCSSKSYCVYPNSLSPQQQQQQQQQQQPTCACINENMMGENCDIPIHNENNNNNNNNSKSCQNGSCWYIGLIVGILLVLISVLLIIGYFGRRYYQRRKYSPLSNVIQDQQ